jgi:SAM-dependent methyltransferase
MALPDLSRLSAAKPAILRAFGQRLTAIGVDLAAAEPVVSAAKHLDPALRRPVRAFHLRQRRDPVGFALRMFLFEDPVTPAEAREALGDLTGQLIDLGLLEERAGAVISPFVLGIFDDLYVLSDVLHHGGDAVMGLGDTTIALVRAACPRRSTMGAPPAPPPDPRPVGRVLDLGCGAGTGALVLSRAASQVVGTDINPRAVALARINAAVNGVEGIDFRQGDGFAPVEGERFDLVFSQPPFVPRPEGAGAASALYGGALGDELCRSLLAATPKHLTPTGRAVFIMEWPDHGDLPVPDRIRAAVGGGSLGPDLLILEAPPTDLGVHATAYAAGFHPTLGPAFEADALARLQHLERAGVRQFVPTVVVIANPRAPAGRDPWTAVVPIEPLAHVHLTTGRIDKLVAARDLLGRAGPILASTLRVPEGTVLSQVQVGPGAEVPSTLHARFPPDAGSRPIEMSMEMLFLVTLVHEAPTVRAALPRVAEVLQVSPEEAQEKALGAAQEALIHGLLEVATA